MPLQKTLATLIVAASTLAAHAADNNDAQKLYTQSLAATCANCHGTEGRALKDASVPGLSGLSADTIIEQMKAFKSGERNATIMHQIAKGFTDQQIQQLANYFASQKR
jgi:sulfide dehydrogenase cytochrome subunit